MTHRSPGRLLVVEDQDDLRQMLTLALEMEGYSVDTASNAREGLDLLRQRRYDLVLSDYAMPGATGTWMLQEAARLGLLTGTASVIVTAHPHQHDLADLPVISKPLDLERFLGQVRGILATTATNEGGGVLPNSDHRIELVLYISSASPASVQARGNLERLLARFDASQVKCSVLDLVREPFAGEEDR